MEEDRDSGAVSWRVWVSYLRLYGTVMLWLALFAGLATEGVQTMNGLVFTFFSASALVFLMPSSV